MRGTGLLSKSSDKKNTTVVGERKWNWQRVKVAESLRKLHTEDSATWKPNVHPQCFICCKTY